MLYASALSFKGGRDWNKWAADGKWAGHHAGGVTVMGVMEQDRVRGSREEKGGSRETGMMSLWVIISTGNHAGPIVVIGFPCEQERPGTPPGVFIEFNFKGQQLACGLRIGWCIMWHWRCVFACWFEAIRKILSKLEEWVPVVWCR